MTVEQNHNGFDQGERPSWAWPVHAFVVWLATVLDYITRFKRARRFRPDWRDSWEGLRQSEWLRDQLIAQGVAQLLSNQPLLLDDTKIIIEPPATYGGPRPRTPFDMNRRFIALARWAADPEAIIRERFRRLSRDPAVAHGSTDALRAAHHELRGAAASPNSNPPGALMLSSAQSARPSKHEGELTKARGPPTLPDCRSPTPNYLAGPHQRDRPRTANIDIHTRLNHIRRSHGGHRDEARETRLIPRVVSTPASVSPCSLQSRSIASPPKRPATAHCSKISPSPSVLNGSASSAATVRASPRCCR